MLAVKSSVSIVLTGGFADLSVTVYVTMEQFLTVFVLDNSVLFWRSDQRSV